MGKKQRQKSNTARRIKTSHKKSTINRKIAYQKVDKNLKNINQIISKQMDKAAQIGSKQNTTHQKTPKVQLQTISADQLKRLLSGQKNEQKKPRNPKINLDESLFLQKLMKKWNTDFDSMAKDIKLNRLQWTAKQIQKKYNAYQKIVQEEQQNQ